MPIKQVTNRPPACLKQTPSVLSRKLEKLYAVRSRLLREKKVTTKKKKKEEENEGRGKKGKQRRASKETKKKKSSSANDKNVAGGSDQTSIKLHVPAWLKNIEADFNRLASRRLGNRHLIPSGERALRNVQKRLEKKKQAFSPPRSRSKSPTVVTFASSTTTSADAIDDLLGGKRTGHLRDDGRPSSSSSSRRSASPTAFLRPTSKRSVASYISNTSSWRAHLRKPKPYADQKRDNGLPYVSRYTLRPLHGRIPAYPHDLEETTRGWHAKVFGVCESRDDLYATLPSVFDDEDEAEEKRTKRNARRTLAATIQDDDDDAPATHAGTALCDAIQKGDFKTVKLYVQSGGYSPSESENHKGQRCVHVAAEWGRSRILRFLIDRGANPSAKDRSGRLAISYVQDAIAKLPARRYHPKRARLKECFHLLSETSVFKAASSGDLNRVKWLIERGGANVNAPNTYGMTPLHLAASKGNVDICKYLSIDAGANIHLENAVGQSAIHVASSRRLQRILLQADVHRAERKKAKMQEEERLFRKAAARHCALKERRVRYKGTSVARRVQTMLNDPDEVAMDAVLRTVDRKRREDIVRWTRRENDEEGGGGEITARGWIARARQDAETVEASMASRLRHARRMHAPSLRNDLNFHRHVPLRADSAHFFNAVRAAGWGGA
eukprot:g4932.t1